MPIKRFPVNVVAEVDTDAKTLVLVVQTPAADGEGDVDLHRIPVDLSGTSNAERRRRLRRVLAAE